MNKSERLIKCKQKRLNRRFMHLFLLNAIVVFVIMSIVLMAGASGNNQSEGENQTTEYECMYSNHDAVILPANTLPVAVNTAKEETTKAYCRNLTENEKLMLAKIAMAEAEGEDFETKAHIVMVVLNRVNSSSFPNTIEEVIFQKNGSTYQFSPVIPGGRWWTTEPNEECWKVVEMINTTECDFSKGALFFESCENSDNWHSRNLKYLFESDGMRFYK